MSWIFTTTPWLTSASASRRTLVWRGSSMADRRYCEGRADRLQGERLGVVTLPDENEKLLEPIIGGRVRASGLPPFCKRQRKTDNRAQNGRQERHDADPFSGVVRPGPHTQIRSDVRRSSMSTVAVSAVGNASLARCRGRLLSVVFRTSMGVTSPTRLEDAAKPPTLRVRPITPLTVANCVPGMRNDTRRRRAAMCTTAERKVVHR